MSKKFEALERFNNRVVSKELEALERFNNGVVFFYGKDLYERNIIDDELRRKNLEIINEEYNLLKEALKRNEPMKPSVLTIGAHEIYGCTNCHKSLPYKPDSYNYCPYCGKKISWYY